MAKEMWIQRNYFHFPERGRVIAKVCTLCDIFSPEMKAVCTQREEKYVPNRLFEVVDNCRISSRALEYVQTVDGTSLTVKRTKERGNTVRR